MEKIDNYSEYIIYSEQRGAFQDPTISFSRDGKICFSKHASALLNIDAGCFITFMQKKSDSKYWCIRKSESGIPVHICKKGIYSNCAEVTRSLLKSFDVLDNFARFRLSEEINKDGLFEIIKKEF